MQITAPQVHAWYDEEQHVVGVTVELILSSRLYLPGISSLWPRKRREPLSRKYREEARLNKTSHLPIGEKVHTERRKARRGACTNARGPERCVVQKMSLPSLDHFNFREYEHFYEPAEDTYLLIDALQADADVLRDSVRPSLCLEIGPGSGLVTAALCAMLREGREEDEGREKPLQPPLPPLQPLFMAADINPQAAAACARTAKANKVEPFEAVCCDLAICMRDRLRRRVDVLLFNPPYVPTPPEEVGSKDIAAAWAGGERGREVIDRFLPEVKELLSPNGCFYMVAVDDNDPTEIISIMRDYGVHAEVVLRRRAKNEALCIIKMRHQ
ncbi:unnamed protein product [Pylaiella littoralis]